MRLLLATGAALLALAAPAAATTETASLGDVRAALSYVKHKQYPYATRLHLRVTRGDVVIADRRLPDERGLSPIGVNTGTRSVRVRDLDGDGEGEALFDLYTGGAHCCEVTYLYDPGERDVQHVHDWGDPGYVLRDLDGDGTLEFRTADVRFQGRFSSFAGSFPPVRVLRYADGGFDAVTGDFPALVRRDARDARRGYRRAVRRTRRDPVYRELVRSTAAAYAADRCVLGDCRGGFALVNRAVNAQLVSVAYARRVHRLLKRFGYDA